ncbi:acetyltransferase [Pseudomonas sp. VI4.1]|jgi:sugar O-acyltransferase (sialic acid O-acetyltransferase NeuD family)|uniref:acetyltransferase n=1 Tax=Pseudomonas sp. VI4.1 TaxID=1941346 RepID=UPI0009D61B12|nr:acetyltransferase [Pseudomonas sp. VI4.1]OPK07604.1 acetyltransferase [Pseudomonas sp. VI4.1]
MKRLAVLGASGHGKVVADTAQCCGWDQVDFYDDAWPGLTGNGSWPVVGDSAAMYTRLQDYQGVTVAIGNNSVRHAKLASLIAAAAPVVSLIHPMTFVSQYASIGPGSVVFAGAVVNADAKIGFGAILNTGCSVDHDCVLGDAVHISPGARLAGAVSVGERSWIGIGASVRQLIRIGSDVVAGAGASVVNDVSDGSVVVGVPAKVIATT